jgi:hypothetical protein
MAQRAAHQFHRCSRIGPVGHDIARANDAIGRNSQPGGLAEIRLRGFEIAVWAAEDHDGPIDAKQGNRSRRHAWINPRIMAVIAVTHLCHLFIMSQGAKPGPFELREGGDDVGANP